MKRMISITTEDGDIDITEDELATVSNADLRLLRISRDELHRVFAEGQRLMAEHGIVEADRVRPCADETREGEWFVLLVRYSSSTDPLLQGEPTRKQKNKCLN